MDRGNHVTHQWCDAAIIAKTGFLREAKPNHNKALSGHHDDELTEAAVGPDRQRGILVDRDRRLVER